MIALTMMGETAIAHPIKTDEIATHLSLNISTVRKHLESIYCKLGVHSRTEAIAQALEKLGILNSSPLI
jgi:DNA-binding NarL/FixJ family response regulator